MRKVQVLIKFGGHPDISGFNAAVVWTVMRGVIRLSINICKVKGDVIKKCFLVALGSKMVMGLSFLNQISCQFTLSQQGIGGDSFSLDVNAVEQRDSDFNFIGLFFFVASFDGQSADFFWV